jgi:hypothetical protein
MQLVTKDEGNASQFQEDRDGVGALPRNPMESEYFDQARWASAPQVGSGRMLF